MDPSFNFLYAICLFHTKEELLQASTTDDDLKAMEQVTEDLCAAMEKLSSEELRFFDTAKKHVPRIVAELRVRMMSLFSEEDNFLDMN